MSKPKKREHTLLNASPGSVYMHYKILGLKGEGTFSQVFKAQNLKTGKFVAIKCMKSCFDTMEQVNKLREIQALRRLSPHPNIIQLQEALYDKKSGSLSLVFECMDKNIYEMTGTRRTLLTEDRIKLYVYQLIKAICHMHENGIFHRDIKPENILMIQDRLKLADFGSCRGIYSKQPFTEYISTRWYRAPECLLTDGYYSYKMDMWGVGCVFFEIMTLFPLFPGNNEADQVHKIHNMLGTPTPEILAKFKKNASKHMNFNFPTSRGTDLSRLLPPNTSPQCIDIMKRLLEYNPEDRITAKQALQHPYFGELRERDMMKKTRLKVMSPLRPKTKKEQVDKDSNESSSSLPSIYRNLNQLSDSQSTHNETDISTGKEQHIHQMKDRRKRSKKSHILTEYDGIETEKKQNLVFISGLEDMFQKSPYMGFGKTNLAISPKSTLSLPSVYSTSLNGSSKIGAIRPRRRHRKRYTKLNGANASHSPKPTILAKQ